MSLALLTGRSGSRPKRKLRNRAPTGPSSCALAQAPASARPASSAAESGLRGVESVQPSDQIAVELAQHHFIVQAVAGEPGVGRVRALREERLRRPVADELGETLVERRRALHVERVVRDLVEDERRQLDRIARQRRREQRIVEPAKGGERGGGTQVDVVALLDEPIAGAPRGVEVEEPLIRDPPDDGVLPGVRADAVLGRRLEHEQERIAPHVGVGGVGLLGLESDLGRVVTALQHQAQRVAHRRIGRAVTHQVLDRLARMENAGLFQARASDIANVLARQISGTVPREDGRDHDQKYHRLHRRRRTAVRGMRAGGSPPVPAALVNRRSVSAPASGRSSTCCPDPARSAPLRV